jgi:hypothetical protein
MLKGFLFGLLFAVLCALPASASASSAHWVITSVSAPTYFAPGDSSGDDSFIVDAVNAGGSTLSGENIPITVTDTLPAGLTPDPAGARSLGIATNASCTSVGQTVTCTDLGLIEAGGGAGYADALKIKIPVDVGSDAAGSVTNTATVSGGGAAAASVSESTTIDSTPPAFGIQHIDAPFSNADGSSDTQAGSHPYSFTFGFNLNSHIQPGTPFTYPVGQVKNAQVELPVGLVGNPNAVPKCSYKDFLGDGLEPECPADTQIGIAEAVTSSYELIINFPVFNMVPPPGVPAQFAFNFADVNTFLDAAVRTGGDYGITVHASDIAQREVLGSSVTLLGVVDGKPFLTMPTSCTGPLTTSLSVNSWEEQDTFASGSTVSRGEDGAPTGLEGCERVDFSPSISVRPETSVASTPTGLSVDLHEPQNENPAGLAEGNVKKAVVALPAGMVISPSAADGLGACSPEEIGLNNDNPVSCPASSKVGSVEIDTPLLEHPSVGSVYVAQQTNNPFGSLLALYLVAEGSGALVKTAGEVRLDPVSGQITAVFDNIPQLPFSDVKLNFFGGPRAALATPAGCGTYTTSSQLTPYSSGVPAEPSDSFSIASGCAGGQFSPSFTAGSESSQAGAFSPFGLTLSRTDQDQDLASVTVKAPPGVSAILRGVERCGEPQAAQGTCGAGSLIGHATVAAGEGPDPYWVKSGQMFLTGPYKGAPFGLSVVVPAVAGPFDLGNVVVRAAINVDPYTAQITVSSDPLPTILQGIPLDIRTVNVAVDRPDFTFNPTDCEPLAVTGALSSTQGATVGVSSAFQATNCQGLSFKPAFAVSTQAKTSKHGGASLIVKGVFPAGNANIHSVAVTLPKQLPARLTTIQQACTEAQFAVNPAGCPAGSDIGVATASTPILAAPVSGPVYLVSHGGAAFPNIVAILQGEGITVDLTGSIDIKHGVTSSTFASVPDTPIASFMLSLPEGPHSGLAAVVPANAKGSMCGQSLTMPFTITGQNGAVVKQTVKIAVTGCPRAKKKSKAKAKRRKKK